MRAIVRITLLLALATAGGTACVTTRAATPADRPALDVPDPPARVVAQLPTPEPPLPVLEVVDELPAGTKPSSPTRTNKPAPKDPPKPEVKPDPPPTTEAPPPAQPPSPQLRMPEPGDAGAVSRQIRDIVERTRRSLGQINRASLTVLRQKAYDDAQLFVKQAEHELNAKNVVFAKELADKAERLAKELLGR